MPQRATWKVIHVAKSETHSAQILEALKAEGLLARSREVYRALSSEENYYEIMVLSSEAVEAQKILIERSLLL